MDGKVMVPRVFKTNVGDIFTTNAINTAGELTAGKLLTITGNGLLTPADSEEVDPTVMTWEVVKVYTMPDGQKGVKIMRIA